MSIVGQTAHPGFATAVYKNASPVAFTGQTASESSVDAGVYQIRSPMRQVLDYSANLTIAEAGTTVFQVQNGVKNSSNTEDYEIDYLFGIFTRAGGSTSSAITVSGNYIPRVLVGGVENLDWDWITETATTTTIGSRGVERTPTLDDLTMTFGKFYRDPSGGAGDESFADFIGGGDPALVEYRFLNTPATKNYTIYTSTIPSVGILRAWMWVTDAGREAADDGVVMEDVSLESANCGVGNSFRLIIS